MNWMDWIGIARVPSSPFHIIKPVQLNPFDFDTDAQHLWTLGTTQVTNDRSYSVQCHLNESYWIAKILATQIQNFLWCVQYMFNFLHRSSSHVMGWSVPVWKRAQSNGTGLEKLWNMPCFAPSNNITITTLQSLRPTLVNCWIDWAMLGECITLDIHILLCCSECSETWLLLCIAKFWLLTSAN